MSKKNGKVGSYGLDVRRRTALKRRQKDLVNLEKIGVTLHAELAKMQPPKPPKKNKRDHKRKEKETEVAPQVTVIPEVLNSKLEELRIYNEKHRNLCIELLNIQSKLIS